MVWGRIVSRTVRQLSDDDTAAYEIALTIQMPSPDAAETCGQTDTTDLDPLGGVIADTGNVVYLRPGVTYPTEPAPGHEGSWHFGVFGAGGPGTIDYAGDCVQNRLRLLVEGEGTMVISMETYLGSARNLIARLMHSEAGMDVLDEQQSGTTASTFTFDVTTHNGTYCTHYIDVRDKGDICGGKWGWSGAEWTAS
jgi:hypothetical protein